MSWRIVIHRKAEKEMESFPLQIQQRLLAKILSLRENPFPDGVVKLKAHSGYRLRVGDYRILYEIEPASKLIKIYAIGHRKDIYR